MSKNKICVNKNYVNVKIHGHILSEKEMREIGFTDYDKKNWYFCRYLTVSNQKKYKGIEITFNVTLPKDGGEIAIDILDEAFLQPYDYQLILANNPQHEFARIVQKQVEDWMAYLQEKGVISGHIPAEYI